MQHIHPVDANVTSVGPSTHACTAAIAYKHIARLNLANSVHSAFTFTWHPHTLMKTNTLLQAITYTLAHITGEIVPAILLIIIGLPLGMSPSLTLFIGVHTQRLRPILSCSSYTLR
jgi:hypothetical protein